MGFQITDYPSTLHGGRAPRGSITCSYCNYQKGVIPEWLGNELWATCELCGRALKELTERLPEYRTWVSVANRLAKSEGDGQHKIQPKS